MIITDLDFTNFISKELIVIIPVLMAIGKAIKRTNIPDNIIPIILGVIGILLSTLWILSVSTPTTINEWFAATFSSLVQGILCASAAVYGHQIIKQAKKNDDDSSS